jgi:hypothetical protein
VSDQRIQELIADACLRGLGDESLEERAARFGVSPSDVEALRKGPQRLGVYRRLVRNNLLGVTSRMMPRTRARLNALTGSAFDASFDSFLAEAAPTTHYLRDVPAEFLAWVKPLWEKDARVPKYASDLGQHELVHFQVAAAPPLPRPPAIADLSLDRRLVFTPARRLMRYAHAVHTLPDDLEDRSEPEARDVALFLYRDEENTVRVLELTELAALIAENLLFDMALGEAVAKACATQGTALTPDVLASTARMLADWAERGLILGASEWAS